MSVIVMAIFLNIYSMRAEDFNIQPEQTIEMERVEVPPSTPLFLSSSGRYKCAGGAKCLHS